MEFPYQPLYPLGGTDPDPEPRRDKSFKPTICIQHYIQSKDGVREMKCEVCGRNNLTQKELEIHKRYFHKVSIRLYQQPQRMASGACPECGATLWFQEGCIICQSCSHNKCD